VVTTLRGVEDPVAGIAYERYLDGAGNMQVDRISDDIGGIVGDIGQIGIGKTVHADHAPFFPDRIADADISSLRILGVIVVFAFGIEEVGTPGQFGVVEPRVGIPEIVTGA